MVHFPRNKGKAYFVGFGRIACVAWTNKIRIRILDYDMSAFQIIF